MIKIKIDEKEVLTIDGNEKHIKDLTPSLLEEIVKSALKDDVSFDLQSTTPIAELFREIQDKTKEGSELRKQIRKIEDEIKESEKLKNEKIEDNYLAKAQNQKE